MHVDHILGHLSTEQRQAFLAFKMKLAEANLYTPSTEDRGASHDDSTLLYVLTLVHVLLLHWK
jgi:hypothetical protein